MPLIPGFLKIRTRKDEVSYSFAEWKKELDPEGLRVRYEFNHWANEHKVSVEFHTEPLQLAILLRAPSPGSGKMLGAL